MRILQKDKDNYIEMIECPDGYYLKTIIGGEEKRITLLPDTVYEHFELIHETIDFQEKEADKRASQDLEWLNTFQNEELLDNELAFK